MSNLYWPSEAQMERLKPYFPKSHGVPRVDDRRVLDLSRFDAAPRARLGHLAFEGQRAFPSLC